MGSGTMLSVKVIIRNLYMKKVLKNEKVFNNGECELKYLFLKNKNSNKLMIIFSGFPPTGKPPVYNYVLKFKDIDCNKLYILDDSGSDSRGSYYLGMKNNFFIDRAVTQLVDKVRVDNGIKKEDILTIGTSKGGFASLYFSLKNGYGAAIAGEPQILLGNYLKVPHHKNILSYIMGDINQENIKYLNGLIINLIDKSTNHPRLYLHCGNDSDHHKYHLKALLTELDDKKVKYDLDLGNYQEHGGVGKHFPAYAFKSIKDELSK